MGQLLQIVLDNLFKLWPYRIIDIDCNGLRFVRKGTDILLPGGHWFFPGLQRIEEFSVVYQELDCLIQSIETKDGASVSFSANLGYVVTDIRKARCGLHHRDATLERALRGHLANVVADADFASSKRERKKLCTAAKAALKLEAEKWGVDVQIVRLTDFVKAQQQRRFMSHATASAS